MPETIWIYPIISVVIISLVSMIGIVTFIFKVKNIEKLLLFLVSFSAGALLGDAMIHLLPEVVKEFGFNLNISLYVLGGILIFFVLEKVAHWRHCHHPTTKDHPHHLGIMNLIGDGLHNFIDGMIIAGSFSVNISLGIYTSIAVLLHEIPQEIGDFGILVHAGYSKKKALLFNLLSASLAVIGVVITLIVGRVSESFIMVVTSISVGGFVYIAASDLIPELHKKTTCDEKAVMFKTSLFQLVGILLGIGIMVSLLVFG